MPSHPRLCLAAATAVAAMALSGAPASAATCATQPLSHGGNTGSIQACGVDVVTTSGATHTGKVGTVALTNNGPTMTYFSRGAVTVKWGDGTPSSTGVVAGNGDVTTAAGHKYTSAGTKTIEIVAQATRRACLGAFCFPSNVGSAATGTGVATVEAGSGPTVAFTHHDVWQTTSPATMQADATDTDGVKSLSCRIGSAAPTTGDPQTLSTATQGTHTVTCDAVDANDAASTYTAKLKLDTTAPVVSGTSKTVNATSPGGATVGNVASASDPHSGVASTVCSPAGPLFAIGTTQVSCTATNHAGLTSAPASFTVWVKSGPEQLVDLSSRIRSAGGSPSLVGLVLQAASPGMTTAQRCTTLSLMDLLLYAPNSWSNKKLPSLLTIFSISSDVNRIEAVLGC